MNLPAAHKLRELAKEEEESSRMYRRMGLRKTAMDEARHAQFLRFLAAKQGRK